MYSASFSGTPTEICIPSSVEGVVSVSALSGGPREYRTQPTIHKTIATGKSKMISARLRTRLFLRMFINPTPKLIQSIYNLC